MSKRVLVLGLVAAAAFAVASAAAAQEGAAQEGVAPEEAAPEGAAPGVGLGFAGATEARWLERHAKELGLDEATLARVRAIGEEAGADWNRRMGEIRAESRKLAEQLAADLPDEAALAKQARAMGGRWTEGLEERLRTSVKLRKLLTPEQRKQAAELRRKPQAGRRGGGPQQ